MVVETVGTGAGSELVRWLFTGSRVIWELGTFGTLETFELLAVFGWTPWLAAEWWLTGELGQLGYMGHGFLWCQDCCTWGKPGRAYLL